MIGLIIVGSIHSILLDFLPAISLAPSNSYNSGINPVNNSGNCLYSSPPKSFIDSFSTPYPCYPFSFLCIFGAVLNPGSNGVSNPQSSWLNIERIKLMGTLAPKLPMNNTRNIILAASIIPILPSFGLFDFHPSCSLGRFVVQY